MVVEQCVGTCVCAVCERVCVTMSAQPSSSRRQTAAGWHSGAVAAQPPHKQRPTLFCGCLDVRRTPTHTQPTPSSLTLTLPPLSPLSPSPTPTPQIITTTKITTHQVYQEGTHFMLPWFERPVIFDVRARPSLIQSQSGSRDLQMVSLQREREGLGRKEEGGRGGQNPGLVFKYY